MKLSDNPLALLIGVGAMLGLNFPLGKLALAAGIEPAIWAAFISFASGLALRVIVSFTEPNILRRDGLLTFSFVSGFLSYVMPNLLTFTVIPKIGSGLAGIMFALSPVATAILSLITRVRPPNALGLIGIGVGLLGAVLIVWGKNADLEQGFSPWLALALLVPCFLAAGNVYRTQAWPSGASPRLLASATNLAAVPFLAAIALVLAGKLNLQPLAGHPLLCVVQLVVSTTMFLMFFRLQQIGGPTYLSQIGYVAAAVGLFAGVLYFRETYPIAVWIGAAIIFSGIVISTLSARRP